MKVEKLVKKEASDGDDYIVELKDGRTVQVQINPSAHPYFYNPVTNEEEAYVLSMIDEYEAGLKK